MASVPPLIITIIHALRYSLHKEKLHSLQNRSKHWTREHYLVLLEIDLLEFYRIAQTELCKYKIIVYSIIWVRVWE